MRAFILKIVRHAVRTGIMFALLISALPIPVILAASYNLKEETPEVKAAMRNRQGRFETIQGLKTSGSVGENKSGYLAVVGQAGASAQNVVNAENADRKTIYHAIVTQNSLPPSALTQVEEAFAEVQRDRAQNGESIQLPSGQWTKK